MEIMGADYRIAEQRLNYEAASATLAPLFHGPEKSDVQGIENRFGYFGGV
jgi:hypothetical protein